MVVFLSILFCIFVIFLYFVPSFIAMGRKHSHVLQITLLNALLGWSFFGWAAALIWSTTDQIDENVSIKLPWIIIAIFTAAIIVPVIFFWSIFGFYAAGPIEIKTPQNVEKIEYRGYFYKLNPESVEKEDNNKEDNNKEDNKKEDNKKTSPDNED